MSRPQVISFEEALEQTEECKRHLLLGNGFSIALFPDRFRYGSLLEEADFTNHPQARQAFDVLGTTDFEAVIQALRQAVLLLPLYGGDEASHTLMNEHAEALKELLVQAIAGNHSERPSDITEAQYQACRTFLAHFAGEVRNRGNRQNWQGCIFSLNYDLLLYWTLLHDQAINWNAADPLASTFEAAEPIVHDDGFRAPDHDYDAPYVTWDGEDSNSQSIFYLHGALHLFDYGHELQKKCWKRSGEIPLVDQIRGSLNEGRFPLFVSEGDSQGKYERIRHADYLHKGLRSFRSYCNVKSACLFIFGHSLADNDAHVLRQIEKGKIGRLYVSLYGDPDSDFNKTLIRRAFQMAAVRSERFPLDVVFFDAASAKVWGGAQ